MHPMPANELSALARRFACSDPHDAAAQKVLLDELCAVRQTLDPAKERAVCEAVDGALLLTSYMTRMGHVGGPHVLGIIARLLDSAADDPVVGRPAPSAQAAAASPAAQNIPTLGEATPGALEAVRNMLLGEILVQRGFVRQDQIMEALRHQRRSGGRFGEALLELKLVTPDQIQEAPGYQSNARSIAEQFTWREQREKASKPHDRIRKLRVLPKEGGAEEAPLRLMSDVLLGDILVRNGTVSKAQLDEALRLQRTAGLRLGEALVRTGALTKLQLEFALQLQHKMRKRA
jgi:hypothetical protein